MDTKYGSQIFHLLLFPWITLKSGIRMWVDWKRNQTRKAKEMVFIGWRRMIRLQWCLGMRCMGFLMWWKNSQISFLTPPPPRISRFPNPLTFPSFPRIIIISNINDNNIFFVMFSQFSAFRRSAFRSFRFRYSLFAVSPSGLFPCRLWLSVHLRFYIPTYGFTQSFNVSASVAVCLNSFHNNGILTPNGNLTQEEKDCLKTRFLMHFIERTRIPKHLVLKDLLHRGGMDVDDESLELMVKYNP